MSGMAAEFMEDGAGRYGRIGESKVELCLFHDLKEAC